MALDFGDAGLFDPLTPQNGKKSTNGTSNNKRFDFEKEDDENDNIHSNGWGNGDKESGSDDEDEDKDADLDELESWPSAPPLDILDCIKGYETVSFDATQVPPPPFEESDSDVEIKKVNTAGEEDPNEDEDGVEKDGTAPDGNSAPEKSKMNKVMIAPEIEPKLTEAQVRAALLSHISAQCCYGTGAARNMVVKKMEYLPSYHYELQTFTEKRETSWTYAAIRNEFDVVLGSSLGNGIPPLPWEIFEEPAQAFKDEVRLVQVPNTASTKSCHRCRGTGGVTCRDCNGKGWSRCLNCHGDGWMHDSSGHRERCFYCQHSKHGHGQQDCSKCGSKGRVNCTTCEGQGQIRCYIQLSITWKTNTAEHIIERLGLPSDLIRDVSGQVAYEEEGGRVKPIGVFSEELGIKDASTRLVFNHLNSFADHKVIRQRHQVRIVPVTKVTYEWKGKLHVFYVYGYENKIHLPKYPQKCCWGCQIL